MVKQFSLIGLILKALPTKSSVASKVSSDLIFLEQESVTRQGRWHDAIHHVIT